MNGSVAIAAGSTRRVVWPIGTVVTGVGDMLDAQASRAIVEYVREILGPLYNELLRTMIDLGTAPIFLFLEDRPRLVDLRERAMAVLVERTSTDQQEVDRLLALLPQVMRIDAGPRSLMEAATWLPYFAISVDDFAYPDSKDRAFENVPALLQRVDGDGLVDVSGLDARLHGVIYEEYALQYHSFLRRSFRSNINYNLIGAVLACTKDGSASARLALDSRRLRYVNEYEEWEERDYWYGPPLSDELLDDPRLDGSTVHGDPEAGSYFHPYLATEFRWVARDGLKILEIEEQIAVLDDYEEPIVLVRYLHAIRDPSTRSFTHCDGAVKAYPTASYPRIAGEFRSMGRAPGYRKVFRVDGTIDTQQWSQIIALWFRGNQLVHEYLASISRTTDQQTAT
ncbi:MAG: hypothetical protein ACYC90_05075 [Candidatus Nanopelagicales bacterium]